MGDTDSKPIVSHGPAGGDFVPGEGGSSPSELPIAPVGLSTPELDRLNTLIPGAFAAHASLIMAMTARGLKPYIGQCGRTSAQQQAAIDAGTTSAHQHISWHELGRAVDYRARLGDGSEDTTTHNEPFFRALFEEAGKIEGMRSLAYNADGSKLLLGGHLWDAGHVEFREPFTTLLAAVKAEAPELLVA